MEGGPCNSCCPLPPHLAHPGAAKSSVQRETTCGESWCRSRAHGLARNCLPLSFPTTTFALHSAQLRPLPEVCPPRRTLSAGGDSGTLPANSAPSEARPRKGRWEGELATSCSSVSSSVQLFKLFSQGSHTVNHVGGMQSPPVAGSGPASGWSGLERIYLRILSCTYVPRRTFLHPPPGAHVHVGSWWQHLLPRKLASFLLCVSVPTSQAAKNNKPPTRVSFAYCQNSWPLFGKALCSVFYM